MDMDRCCEVTSMVYTDIMTFPRSTAADCMYFEVGGKIVVKTMVSEPFWAV